jgi:RNA polymerase sigma-70 factor (ECF subfamily)
MEPPQPSDATLVEQCLLGNRESFAILAERYYRPVASFLFRRLGRTDPVEDLTQETFLQAYRSLKDGRRPERFSSWLFGIAHHCLSNWLRSKRPSHHSEEALEQVAGPPLPSVQEELEEQNKIHKTLASSLADLPEETRQILELKHRHGKTCEEIAAELKRPVGTIKSLLSRTYKTLRDRLHPVLGDVP